jgi:hypothetical protein
MFNLFKKKPIDEAQRLRDEHLNRDAIAKRAVDDPESLNRILFRGRPRRKGPEMYRPDSSSIKGRDE